MLELKGTKLCSFPRDVTCLDRVDQVFFMSQPPSSQIVSRSRSPLLSAPQTLHRFLLSLMPRPPASELKLIRLLLTSSLRSSLSTAAFSLAMLSASASSSGVSSMVSNDDTLGDLERADVGVEVEEDDIEFEAG